MLRRLLTAFVCLSVPGWSVWGCGRTEPGSDAPSTGGAATSGVGGGAGNDGVDSSGDCDVEVVDSNCAGDCPITADLLVRCDVAGFGRPGPRVAPLAEGDGIYLVTASEEHAWFVTLSKDGSADFEELPDGFDRHPIHLTLSPEGRPALAVDQHHPQDVSWDHGVVVYEPLESDPIEHSVAPEGGDIGSFEYDAAGRLHLGYRSGPKILTHVARGADGDFSIAGTFPWETGFAPAWTDGGTLVSLSWAESDAGFYLTASTGNETQPLHAPLDVRSIYPIVAPPALPKTEMVAEESFVVAGYGNALVPSVVVVESTDDGLFELELDLPPPLSPRCLQDHDGYSRGSCPETCEEVVDGIGGDISLARTSDGRIWVSFLHTFVDETQVYTESCWTDDGDGCACNIEVTRNGTHTDVVLLELDLAASRAREALRVSTRSTDPFRMVGQPLDLRAFGTELAIGVNARVLDRDASRLSLRVFEVDTSRIEHF